MHFNNQTEHFITKYFQNTTIASFTYFLNCISKEYNDIWTDSDQFILKQIGNRLRLNLNVNGNDLDLRVVRSKCKNNGILGMILQTIKELNSSQRNTLDQISEILPRSFVTQSKQSDMIDISPQPIQKMKEMILNYSKNLMVSNYTSIDEKFRQIMFVLQNKIKYLEKIAHTIQSNSFEIQQKRKMESKIIQMSAYINRLQRQLQQQNIRRNQTSKRRITLDNQHTRGDTSRPKIVNFALKQNTQRMNVRFV